MSERGLAPTCREMWALFLAIPEIKNTCNVCRNSQLPGPKVIKLFSYSTQLSMKFILPINVKMPTIVGILTILLAR